ncbi:hypothetical protein BHE74_00038632 [Ensete ventricosum]|nr:hypothetical protein BHE74_00038632 [Ensete ventricosum]
MIQAMATMRRSLRTSRETRARHMDFSVELAAVEGLSEGPGCRSHVVGDDGAAVAGGDLEGEGLAVEEGVALPVLAPVPGHGLPPGPGPPDGHRIHVACSSDVGDEHQVEVGVAIDGEPDAASLPAGDPDIAAPEETSNVRAEGRRKGKEDASRSPTCGMQPARFQLCTERCGGRRAEIGRSAAGGGYTTHRRRSGGRRWVGRSWWRCHSHKLLLQTPTVRHSSDSHAITLRLREQQETVLKPHPSSLTHHFLRRRWHVLCSTFLFLRIPPPRQRSTRQKQPKPAQPAPFRRRTTRGEVGSVRGRQRCGHK